MGRRFGLLPTGVHVGVHGRDGWFTDDFALFEGVDAKVFGISVDSVPALIEFKAKNGFGIDLLSDFKRDVCRAYGTIMVRWVFVEAELGDRRDNAELLGQLRELA